ncbi:MAG: ABC transporter permease, partial [SAR324 cluster bacterium]|nr:ABC transporter permease [SAR324 cluster bacterium]
MSIAEVQVEAEIETFADKDPWYSVALDLIKRKPLGAAGAFIVLIMILMAVFAELIAPYDPELNNYEFMLVGPDWTFLLGT